MHRLQDGGVDVPGDLAVVGWDDVMTARYVRPGLTTVRQPVQELGALAAERLHQRVTGGAPHEQLTVLPTAVVIRESCGCRPAARHTAPPAQHRPRTPPRKESEITMRRTTAIAVASSDRHGAHPVRLRA